jgi:hypothetical protein
MSRLSLVCILAVALAACTAEVEPAKVELRPAPVKVTIGGGGFCPPGQGKKGNC